MTLKEEELGKLYSFNELYAAGVRPGDIVAHKSNHFNCGNAWDYVLLRDGFPDNYNAALCCYKDPRNPDKHMHLCEIGFRWCGHLDYKFRIANEGEIEDFKEGCLECLRTPIRKPSENEFLSIWREKEYAQIFAALLKYKLVDYFEAVELNKELKRIHKVDLIKVYNTKINH